MNRFLIVALAGGVFAATANMATAQAAPLTAVPAVKVDTQAETASYHGGFYGVRSRHRAERGQWRFAPRYQTLRGYRDPGYRHLRPRQYGYDRFYYGRRQFY
ncbi:MAG: hypothetical protein J0I57_04520 [Hyphomicrobium sp.]|nr:hypothetical protein [Hyphomicrobium sp.]MBN9276881.1 hypothetical protein [Hyphomicrobium sp.]